MKIKLIKSLLTILIPIFLIGCVFNSAKDRLSFNQLSRDIISGSIHKGITVDQVTERIGKPSEKSNPTIYNNTKSQTLIYKSSSKAYYLYFKNDKLIEWKLF